MSADVWEELVERYLVQERGFVTRRNHRIDENHWTAQIDILAFDFRENICWMVEVSTGNGAGIIEKARKFDDYRARLKLWTSANQVIPSSGDWTFSMMSFVRSNLDDLVSAAVSEINKGTSAAGCGKNLEETVLVLLGMGADEARRRIEGP